MPLLPEAIAAAVNHLLGQADWARARLAEHAGKRMRIALPLAVVSLDVDAGGRLTPAHAEGLPDVSIELPPAVLADWLVDRDQAWRRARVSGDDEFAQAIAFVAVHLQWDFEEDLSPFIGDIAAHRVGVGLRAAARLPRRAAQAGARNAAEYLSEETHLLATRLEADTFTQAVDDLRDAAERLDKRLGRLERALAGRTHR